MGTISLPIHSYRHASRPVGTERLVNCFAERSPPNGKAPTIVTRSPGAVSAVSLGLGPGRGIYAWNGALYAVSGGTLYSISSGHVATAIGTISGTARCSFGINPTQLVINSAPDAYYLTGATLTQITDADYTARGGAQCTSLDGYILFREPNSGRFFSSDLNDASAYDGLYFATAEGFPDDLVGIDADHRQIVLMGANSCELWENVGGAGFPFARAINGFLELGAAAGYSMAKADNSIYWLASDLTVRRLEGLTPMRVSHHGVEQAIRGYTISDAHGFGYTQDGHVFYVLQFPTSEATWVYDATTQEWHERASYGDTRWRPVGAAFCYGRTYVQRYDTGAIGYLDPDTYTDFGDILRAEWTFGTAGYAGGQRTFHGTLECLAEAGVGLTTGQGSDPEIMLDVSDDGGRTWRAMPNKKLGKIGEYRNRIRWHRLGSSRDRIYRMAVSDPVKVTVSDATLQVDM